MLNLSNFKRLRVKVKITPTEFDDFTAKIVKSFLSCASKEFLQLFSTEGGYKEFHVTPLMVDGKAIYPKRVVKCSFCKDERPKGRTSVKIPEKVYFEVAGPEELLVNAYSFEYCSLNIKGKKLEMETIGVEEVKLELGEGEALLVKIRGPAVLRDPWREPGEGLRTRFLPLPLTSSPSTHIRFSRTSFKGS